MNAIIDQKKEDQLELPFYAIQEDETEFQIQQRVYEKFGLGYKGPPRRLSDEEKVFFASCLMEEAREFSEAESIEDDYDAVLDIITFGYDILIRMGLPFREGFVEVAKANLKKEVAGVRKKSKRCWELDLIKPTGWTPPNLSKIVKGLKR